MTLLNQFFAVRTCGAVLASLGMGMPVILPAAVAANPAVLLA